MWVHAPFFKATFACNPTTFSKCCSVTSRKQKITPFLATLFCLLDWARRCVKPTGEAPSRPHSEHSASDDKQNNSYFCHSELQRIPVDTCRFRSQGGSELRSDTDTARHILHRNCLSHTLTGETRCDSGLEKHIFQMRQAMLFYWALNSAQLNENYLSV